MLDRTFERLLTATAHDLAYPETPDLRARVLTALTADASSAGPAAASPSPRGETGLGGEEALRTPRTEPVERGRGASPRPAFAALVVVVLAVLALTLAIAPTRDAIARLFGVEGSRIEFLPTPPPGESSSPYPITSGTQRASGVEAPIELDDIPEKAGFRAVLPDVPDERLASSIVFYLRQAVVVHHYERFDLWQTRLEQDAGFGKGVPEGGMVQEVEVDGVPGVWLTGAPHYVYYYAGGFNYYDEQRIVERSTLVWRTEAFFYRLETDLPLADALRIAETLP